jgi:allantoicase
MSSVIEKPYQASFLKGVELSSEKVGGKALLTNDEFFAGKENLLKVAAPIFIPGKYTEFGKWMDGWESRRKRNLGPGNDHDWCVIELGLPGVIQGLNVDTAFFVGNYPEYCAVDALATDSKTAVDMKSVDTLAWKEILPLSALGGGTENLFPISSEERWTHLRLRIFPDGGVARLRVFGEVIPNLAQMKADQKKGPIDLAGATQGGKVIACNGDFFGPKDNLILPGRAMTMGEGWETRRKRGPGNDWIVVRLASTGRVRKLEVDTNHFKGNFPESCSIEGCLYPKRDLNARDFRDLTDLKWEPILPRTKLEGHTRHIFEKELVSAPATRFDYVRMNIFPDGGISRLRVFGEID